MAVVREEYAPDVILKAALEFLDSVKDKPFFLYFPTTLPHANGEAPRRARTPMKSPALANTRTGTGPNHKKAWRR